MRIERTTFTQEYKVFAIGERIRPCSRRSGLPDGVYVVTDYHPPLESSEVGVVFVAGEQYGMDACYFDAVPFQDAHAMEADSGAGPDAHFSGVAAPSLVFAPPVPTPEELEAFRPIIDEWRKRPPVFTLVGSTISILPIGDT